MKTLQLILLFLILGDICHGQTANEYFDRGTAKYALGNYKDAIADYSKAIEINPKYPIAYYNRGNIKEELNDLQGAMADYNKAIEIIPEYADAYNNRGIVK